MPKKLDFEHIKSVIYDGGDTLLSTSYNNNRELLEIKCQYCEEIYLQNFLRYSSGFKHKNCKSKTKPKPVYKKPIILKPIECKVCKIIFQPKKSSITLCSIKCAKQNEQTQDYKNNAKLNGRKGGLISAQKQNRRSKNEIYFSELCEQHFGKDAVTTNEKFFDGWDADVIIHSIKTAVLWNGCWHYKQITKKHCLEQVQSRDAIKNKIIEKYGYRPYTVKDMGKYNKSFVEQEFELFRLSMIDI